MFYPQETAKNTMRSRRFLSIQYAIQNNYSVMSLGQATEFTTLVIANLRLNGRRMINHDSCTLTLLILPRGEPPRQGNRIRTRGRAGGTRCAWRRDN
jgi:hypothetical protein